VAYVLPLTRFSEPSGPALPFEMPHLAGGTDPAPFGNQRLFVEERPRDLHGIEVIIFLDGSERVSRISQMPGANSGGSRPLSVAATARARMAGAIGDEMPFKTRAFIARWSQCTRPRLRGTVPPAPPAGQERCWRFALPDAGAGSGASHPRSTR